jgi:hypothetical protein
MTVQKYLNVTSTAGRFRRWGGALQLRQPQKFGETENKVWTYSKPLKFLKTAKTFLGKAWHWNHTSLEILGIRIPFIWRGSAKA